MMCIINDDETKNGNKHDDVMKKNKCLKRKKENQKK
jgi:hypothetical protein